MKTTPKEKDIEIKQEKEIVPFLKKVGTTITISDVATLAEATETLSQANQYLKALTIDKETMTKPLNDALKAIRAKYAPTEKALEEIIVSIRKAMTTYQTEQLKKQQEEEEKIAARVGDGKGKLQLETAVKKIAEIPQVEKKVATDSGSVTFKPVKKFEVTNCSQLPAEYILPNETAIRLAMGKGIELPGVRYFTEQVPINRR